MRTLHLAITSTFFLFIRFQEFSSFFCLFADLATEIVSHTLLINIHLILASDISKLITALNFCTYNTKYQSTKQWQNALQKHLQWQSVHQMT